MLITVGGQCQGQLARNRVGLCGWSYETKDGEYVGLTERHKIVNSGESIYQRVKSGLRLAYDPLAVAGSRLITLTPDQTKLAIVELIDVREEILSISYSNLLYIAYEDFWTYSKIFSIFFANHTYFIDKSTRIFV